MSLGITPGATGRQRTPKRVWFHFCLRAVCALLVAQISYSEAAGIYSLGVSADAKVKFKWRTNSEPDLAGYRLYVGTVPAVYTNFVDVGKVTSFELPNLVRGMDYYFALTAYNTGGVESERTPELSCRIPLLPPTIPTAPQEMEAVVDSPPAISTIPDQSLSKNRSSEPIPFTVTDMETGPAALQLAVYSSNPALVPLSALYVEGSDANRSLVIDPANGQTGASLITIAVTDGASVTTISFLVTVAQ